MTAQDKAIQPAEIQAGHTPLAFEGSNGPLSPGIAIVGAGFSGTLLALHLLQRVPLQTRVVLIERNAQFGRGPAYSTGNSSHVLNVPAGKMSAFHSRPLDFLQWLQALPADELSGIDPTATTFVPRRMFGRYIRHLLNQEVKARNHGDQFELIRGDVVDIVPNGGGLSLTLDRNRTVEVDRAVLAIGNFPPAPPPVADMSFYDGPSYRPDPWAADTLDALDPDLPVLLIGTGLTTIDTVISLLDRGHRGPITALSRRGLLPHRHGSSPPPPDMPESDSFPTRVNDLARVLREGSRRCRELGGDWHTVIDELRPITTELWQAMCVKDRARFLRHMRPWWDVHRHRVAGPVADRIDAARGSGQLQIRAGRIREYRSRPDGLTDIVYRPRFGAGLENGGLDCVTAGRVVNCAGPDADYSRIRDPLVRSLLGNGLVRPDPLCLGLDVTANCATLGRDGSISRRLFAVGPVTKGTFWEMTAVPDIRQQAEFLAGQLASLTKPVRVAAASGGQAS
ncbi:FAD/NAD(P)-binding protein [Lichenicoccus roseus]|uniref:FAD-dependent oxidoreductase n=1 Tax=Lichenicoccus roseus TaxID=2683649 RepID=A0A5R9J3E8_9PROT|nr:FAD/NAD(P)-binding protein [Lichenicoccus roseus]TLU71499.1 FAD-dependent oxidoreductase [Lichenicoccus roseus]